MNWTDSSLVLLAVDGEEALQEWLQRLNTEQKAFFKEPYWKDRLTAVAAFGPEIEKQVENLCLL